MSTTSLLEDTAPQRDAAHSAETRERLKRVADQFDKTQLDPQYRAVSGLWGFQMLRNGLREYAAAPVERGQRQLEVHANELQQAFGKLPTGAGWKTHLQLDELSRLANSKDTLGPADRDKALVLAERFQQVAQNPRYRSIAQLDGFESSRQALQQLASQIMQLADSTSSGADDVLQLAEPKSAEGKLQLADPKSTEGKLQLADLSKMAQKMEDVVNSIHQNLNALPQACAKGKSRHAAEIKQAKDRLAALYELIQQQDKEIQELRAALGAKVKILPDKSKPAKTTILPLDHKKPEDGKDTDKSTEKKKKP